MANFANIREGINPSLFGWRIMKKNGYWKLAPSRGYKKTFVITRNMEK